MLTHASSLFGNRSRQSQSTATPRASLARFTSFTSKAKPCREPIFAETSLEMPLEADGRCKHALHQLLLTSYSC